MAAVIRPRLEELPEELVSNIVVKLDTDSSLAFRLTCRVLEHKSIHEWASEYFTHKAIIPSSPSLKALASIAESEKLRGYLHHIYVIPALFSARVFNCCHGRSCKWKHTVRQEEAMHSYVDDQKDLKKNGKLLEHLTHIFKQLPELHCVSLVDSFSSVPAEVNILGHASFTRRTNNTLTTLPLYPEDIQFYAWKGFVWKTMMQAIAFSEISTLKTLTSRLDNMKNPLTLSDLSFNGRTLHHLGKTLRGLESLRLQMTSMSGATGDESHFDKERAIRVMKNVSSLMPSITHLDLSFPYNRHSFAMCQAFVNGAPVSKLRTLRLDGVFVDSKFLGTLICGLVRVENLYLEFIRLSKGTWPTMLEAMLKLKKLKHLHLHLLTVPSGAACFLKPLEVNDTSREDNQDPWGSFPLFGAGGGNGATTAGAAAPLVIPGPSESDIPTDEDGDDDEDDEEDYDDDSEDEDESDDSMPELEPQTEDAPTHSASQPQPQPAPTPAAAAAADNQAPLTAPTSISALAHALSTLYTDSDAETDDSMPNLEPQTADTSSQATTQPTQVQQLPATSTNNSNDVHNSQSHTGHHNTPQISPDPNALESRLGKGLERGRVICLNTAKEIKEHLPRFMKEYHIVDDEMEDDMFAPLAFPMGGAGLGAGAGAGGGAVGGQGQGAAAHPPPPTVANIFNTLFQHAGGNNGHGPGVTIHGPFFGPAPPPAPAAIATNAQDVGTNATAPPASPFAATVESDEGWTDDE
jgi:hypothetical protein